MADNYPRSEFSFSSGDSDDNDGFSANRWIDDLRQISIALRHHKLGETKLRILKLELLGVLSLVDNQSQRIRALDAGEPQGDLESRSYTPTLDEYLRRVGDLDFAREEFDLLFHTEQEENKGEKNTARLKDLLQTIRTVFDDVKRLEERCTDEHLLSHSSDDEEKISLVVSIDGSEELRSYLRPSPYWHERRSTGHKFMNVEEPRIKRKSLNDVDDNSGDETHLGLPPPPYTPPPPPDPAPTYPDSQVLQNEEASHKYLLEPVTSTPNLVPQPLSAEEVFSFVKSEAPEQFAPLAPARMSQNLLSCLRRIWDSNANLNSKTADSSVQTLTCEVLWELPTFFLAHFPPGSQIRNVLTVTGDATTAYASSCEDYITRFSSHGHVLLEAIEKFLTHQNRGEASDSEIKISLTQDSKSRSPERNIPISTSQHNSASDAKVSSCTIEITSCFKNQVEIVNSILWICSAVRYSPGGLKLSSFYPFVDQSQGNKLFISPHPLQTSFGEDIGDNCWYGLFKDQVVAHGFPIPDRDAGKGLEISFENMTTLARSLDFIEVDNGLVAEGLTTLLVPTLKLDHSDEFALQWHLYTNRVGRDTIDRAELGLLDPKMIEELSTGSLAETYHREFDSQVLSSQRAFLGWVPSAKVNVGSSKWTFGGSIALSGKPIMPLTATFTFAATPSVMASKAVEQDKLLMEDNLSRASNAKVAILYDSSTKIGWLIPKSNLILYLTQLLLYRTWKILPGDFNCVFPPPDNDGGSSAFNAIWSSRKIDLPKVVYDTDKKCKPRQLLWLIERICLYLHKLEASLTQLRGEAAATNTTAPKSLIGAELLQVVSSEVSRFKEVKFNQPWTHIAEEESLVLFCSGLGQAIQPEFTSFQMGGLCQLWSNPGLASFGEDSNYLIATGRTIMCLLKKNRTKNLIRLSPSIRWKLDEAKPLFSLHKYQKGESFCHHVQLLESNHDHDEDSEQRIGKVVTLYIDGALVFTRRTHSDILTTRPLRMPLVARPQEPGLPRSNTSTTTPNLSISSEEHNESLPWGSSSRSANESNIVSSIQTNSPILTTLSITRSSSVFYNSDLQSSINASRHELSVLHTHGEIIQLAAQSIPTTPKYSMQQLQPHLPTINLESNDLSTVQDVQLSAIICEPPRGTVSESKQYNSQPEHNVQHNSTRNIKRCQSMPKDSRKTPSNEGDKRQHSDRKHGRGRRP